MSFQVTLDLIKEKIELNERQPKPTVQHPMTIEELHQKNLILMEENININLNVKPLSINNKLITLDLKYFLSENKKYTTKKKDYETYTTILYYFVVDENYMKTVRLNIFLMDGILFSRKNNRG